MQEHAQSQPAASVPVTGQDSQGQAQLRLSRETLKSLPCHVTVPEYDPSQVEPGIVHIGAGNFSLAHLGSFIDEVLRHDRKWGIVAVSLRSDRLISALRKQDGLYVLVEREGSQSLPSVLAPIVETLYGPEDPSKVVAAIADPRVKLVTLTVSNKGYHLAHGALDKESPDVAHDLAGTDSPKTIYWYLMRGLAERRKTGSPLTIMSLDNVEENSRSLKKGLLDFIAPQQLQLTEGDGDSNPLDLAAWIEANVSFPVTLVDRITPETTDEFRTAARELLGFDTTVVVGTESFTQLVVERSKFPTPPWEAAGVQVVDDCSAWWQRKFFCLNAGHQIVGIPAIRLGVTYIHQAMSHAAIASLLERAHTEFATFLPGEPDEVSRYMAAIRRRLSDPALNDTVQRVTARTTSKVSERVLAAVERALAVDGKVLTVPTFVAACWLLNLGGRDEFHQEILVADPDAEKLEGLYENVIDCVRSAQGSVENLQTDVLRSLLVRIGDTVHDARFGRLAAVEAFVDELAWALVQVDKLGVEQAIAALLERAS